MGAEGAGLTPQALASRGWPEVELLEVGAVRALLTQASVTEHPRAFLHLARLLEPHQHLLERAELIARLSSVTTGALRREVLAERAVDLARNVELDGAQELVQELEAALGPDELLTRARALEADGRALAWRGDAASSRRADEVLLTAIDLYGDLGSREWQGFAMFWRGNAVCFQMGRLLEAEEQMRKALELLAVDSPRRAVVLTYYADVLTTSGRWTEVEAVIDEATALAAVERSAVGSAYAAWQRARVCSQRGDAPGTLRAVLETERHPGDWFGSHTGHTFLADAAELLDRVGDAAAADDYLRRALERAPDDEFVRQARAMLLARRGDPGQALVELRELASAPWLEARLVWRHTLMAAYATLRSGQPGAGALTRRALEQAEGVGGTALASVGEPAILQALLPLADGPAAQEMLAGGAPIVRLLGVDQVERNGQLVELPTGRAASLVRLLALHPAGLTADEAVDALWPDSDPASAPKQLRDLQWRLKKSAGDLVVRTGDRLRLTAGWVDAQVFRTVADRALAGPGSPSDAIAALAIWQGDLLPAEPYAEWAVSARAQLRSRRLALLDLLAGRAATPEESLRALSLALEEDAYDETRAMRAAELLLELGRPAQARRLLERAVASLHELDLAAPPALRQMLERTSP